MSRDGSGNYSLPQAAFTAGTTIESAKVNSNFSDIASALTASLAKDGQTTPTANLPMGTYRHTGVGNASARTDYAAAGQIADNAMGYAADTGTADAYAIAPAPGISAYAIGQRFTFKVTNANATTTPTLAVNGLTAGTIKWPDGSALEAGDLPANSLVEVVVSATTPVFHLQSVARAAGAAGAPMGRLTLATGVPVMTSDQTAKTTIYYTPYIGNRIPLWDGKRFVMTVFAELSNDTTASSTGKAGPAAVTTNSNYDLFVWNDAGTVRLTRGPAWTSDTARGTGAGTTELSRVNGILTNTVAITNGPTAGYGTYVGTVRSNGSSQIDWRAGALAASGTAALLGVWNMYHRRPVMGIVADSTDSWTYAGGTYRAANNSSTMRASFIQGWTEDFFRARYDVGCAANSAVAVCAVGLDSTSSPVSGSTRGYWSPGAVSTIGQISATASTQSLGWHYLQALENNGTNTATFYGDGGTTLLQSGLMYEGWF